MVLFIFCLSFSMIKLNKKVFEQFELTQCDYTFLYGDNKRIEVNSINYLKSQSVCVHCNIKHQHLNVNSHENLKDKKK